jgi:outer membrane immunogenic protein
MKRLLVTSIAAVLLCGSTATIAADWSGFHIGGYLGSVMDPDDGGGSILFDTNLDGDFGDTVNTAAGANAFSPGFCDGAANDRTPATDCDDNTGGAEFGLRVGYDWQIDNFVYGVVGEYGYSDARDAVAAFSTTPAFYTMLRKVDDVFALRARAGLVFGDDDRNLVYATGGYTQASIENFFETSNGVNTFVTSGDSDADGFQIGLGYERMLGERFSVGLEYLHTRLDDDEARVRAQGPAPATNPFIRVNPSGTDFRRSDDELDLDSVRLTAGFRF